MSCPNILEFSTFLTHYLPEESQVFPVGDTSISGIEAVGPAGEEAADVVHPARPGGGPAPAGGRLRAYSRPAGRDRLSPPLQARSRRGVQLRRARPAPGLSQTPALRGSGKRPE